MESIILKKLRIKIKIENQSIHVESNKMIINGFKI